MAGRDTKKDTKEAMDALAILKHHIECPKNVVLNTSDIESKEILLNGVRSYALSRLTCELDNPTIVDICLTMGYSCNGDKARFNRLREEIGKVLYAFPENGPWKKFAEACNELSNSARLYRLLNQ